MVTAQRRQKYWWRSKTIWLGVPRVVLAVVTAVLPAGLLAGIGALNVALRVADNGGE